LEVIAGAVRVEGGLVVVHLEETDDAQLLGTAVGLIEAITRLGAARLGDLGDRLEDGVELAVGGVPGGVADVGHADSSSCSGSDRGFARRWGRGAVSRCSRRRPRARPRWAGCARPRPPRSTPRRRPGTRRYRPGAGRSRSSPGWSVR